MYTFIDTLPKIPEIPRVLVFLLIASSGLLYADQFSASVSTNPSGPCDAERIQSIPFSTNISCINESGDFSIYFFLQDNFMQQVFHTTGAENLIADSQLMQTLKMQGPPGLQIQLGAHISEDSNGFWSFWNFSNKSASFDAQANFNVGGVKTTWDQPMIIGPEAQFDAKLSFGGTHINGPIVTLGTNGVVYFPLDWNVVQTSSGDSFLVDGILTDPIIFEAVDPSTGLPVPGVTIQASDGYTYPVNVTAAAEPSTLMSLLFAASSAALAAVVKRPARRQMSPPVTAQPEFISALNT